METCTGLAPQVGKQTGGFYKYLKIVSYGYARGLELAKGILGVYNGGASLLDHPIIYPRMGS